MMKLVRNMLVVAMLGIVSAGAFAQKKDDEKRPVKEPVKVITNDREKKPPPNSNRPKPDPKKKP